MAFKLPGKSVHSGTASHRSALKLVKADAGGGIGNLYTKAMDSEAVQNAISTKKAENANAYGGNKTWGEAQSEGEESGFDLNQTTRDQRAYEKEMKAKHGKDWNKREDNQWKKRQNSINSAVGSTKVYDVDSEVEKIQDDHVKTDEDIVNKGEIDLAKEGPKQENEEGEKVYGAALDATADLNKNELKYTKKIQRQKVKDARKEFGRGSDEVKAAKATKKDAIKSTRKMVRTNTKDQKFVDRDESLDRRITKRKEKGKDTSRLENKKAKNKQKEKEFGESLG